ncbi:polysaccharide biosynthesis tyrosine autokinase [Rhodococcus sp. IEGM 1379]|uniref:polysaccharide biosynthesis tyrosine autokinase n=1 Tax=Rhodococcus sp. IEGM 1379 TaxID=3047086 RepID=UPI0024B64777|nr:polysaccharide biosynthesis tyrosine autokinase [Rhodococcus sp. IEGM 1379]MDI9916914.1 AAA family ATPase [Rhodococcus sp. IEGM 1379]
MTSNFAGTTYRPGNVGNEWLRSAVAAVRNRWMVLLAGALVGGFLGVILTSMQSPSYESSAMIYQTPHFGDTDGTSRQRTEAYTKLLSSDLLIETALGNTGLEMSISDVRKMTTASATVGSAILTVTVRADDADISAELANSLAQALPGTVAALDGTTPVPDESEVVIEDPARLAVADPVRLAVISPAVAGDAEGGPMYVRNIALGVIAGLLVGLLYAYLRTQVSRKVQGAGALGKFLSGPILTGIPADKAMETGVVDFPRDSPAAEAFRRLRTVIADHEPGRAECRTIIVSSAVGGDGKTAVAVNLAVALAEIGNEVIFVDAAVSGDANTRSRRHGVDKEGPTPAGLTDYLLGDAEIDQYVSASWHPKLSLIPGGRAVAGQSELLGSSRMRTGLADLATRANYVIVDTAALTDRSDALVLGRSADGVLLVARSDHTRYAELGAAIERLSLADVRICGVVLNDFPRPLVRSARKFRARLSATPLLAHEARSVRTNV